MTQTAMPVGEKRYRESFGRCYEDFQIGDVYEHRPGRTLTETDNIWFTLLTMNTSARRPSEISAGTTSSSPRQCSSATRCMPSRP
jgi:itaconyl-CoA hydratase